MASVDGFKLIENGFQVFPVQVINPGTDDKEVVFLTPHWNQDATTDPAQVAKWNSEFGSLITDWAAVTGHRAGFIAVDIDSQGADDWWESKWLPSGHEVPTPRGGRHILYSLDGIDADIKTCQNQPVNGIDIRGEGGLILMYSDEFTLAEIPEMPESVLELLPEKQVYSSDPIPEGVEAPSEITSQEERVLRGLTDMLDSLPQPWRKGAGWHDVQFSVACGLNRIANSPHYATNRDQAYALFIKHAPIRDSADKAKRQARWNGAVKAATGQWFEAPSDVPIRLDAMETLDKFLTSATERMFWESKNVGDTRDLIRELRDAGATEQEAYSISYACAAMKGIRSRNPDNSGSTWGMVKSIYESPSGSDGTEEDSAPVKPVGDGSGEWKLLTPEEADIIRNYPNFIDRYMLIAKEIFAEPNLPLHYVNAWIVLSSSIGDLGDIILDKGRRPLSLWALPLAKTASGKGDAKDLLKEGINSCRRGGYSSVNAGSDASAEGMTSFITERPGKAGLFNKDESGSLLHEMHKEGSVQARFMSLSLDLYDGQSNGALRVGNAKDGVGDSVKTVYNMWLQTTWENALASLTSSDIGTGFVGRFLVAIGNDSVITRESLRPKFASEYQVSLGGTHPAVKSLGDGLQAIVGKGGGYAPTASDEFLDRYVDMRQDVLNHIKGHPQENDLKGVMLRVTENMFKASALLAISEGRNEIEMTDLLLAMKSGQYWVRDAIKLSEAIGTSEYRRKVDSVVSFCRNAPKTKSQILRSAHFKNEDRRNVNEWIERAEAEGSIVRGSNGKYAAQED